MWHLIAFGVIGGLFVLVAIIAIWEDRRIQKRTNLKHYSLVGIKQLPFYTGDYLAVYCQEGRYRMYRSGDNLNWYLYPSGVAASSDTAKTLSARLREIKYQREIDKSDLNQRGWTEKEVQEFLTLC